MTDDEKVLTEDTTDAPRIYEVSYLCVPTMSVEDVEKKLEELRSFISKKHGNILGEGKPNLITLAYAMDKWISNKRHVHESAYFGWVKFELLQEYISEFKSYLEKSDSIMRFLIVKTIKDVPIPRRRVVRRHQNVVKKEDIEAAGKVDEAKLDREIEELLTA